jgi:membrane protein YqaA with SNARE-associated domain
LFRPWRGIRDSLTSFHERVSRFGELPRTTRWLLAILIVELFVAFSYIILRLSPHLEGLSQYGYLGAFLASLIATTSIIFPVPGFVVVAAVAAVPDISWPLVALASALGNGLGESTSYLAGYGGAAIIHPEHSRLFGRAEKWMRRYGASTVFVFAITPLPFDIVGIAAGALRFPYWKFILAVIAGRLPLTLTGCYLARRGWESWPELWNSLKDMDWWGWALIILSIAFIIGGTIILWKRQRTKNSLNSQCVAENDPEAP